MERNALASFAFKGFYTYSNLASLHSEKKTVSQKLIKGELLVIKLTPVVTNMC